MGKRNHNSLKKRDPDPDANPKYPSLTKYNIESVEDKVRQDKKYGEDLKELSSFFKEFPTNTNRDIVIHKILLVDITNSTNLKFTPYNGRRLHSALGDLTPDSVYEGRCIPDKAS